jgi:hypothetical protein
VVFFVLKGGEYALRYLRYKQLSRKIVKMSLVDKELQTSKFSYDKFSYGKFSLSIARVHVQQSFYDKCLVF